MERKIHNFESTILVDETIEQYGYHPDKYGKSSLKFVIATCRYCGRLAKIRKAFFNKAGSACHKECRIEEQRKMSPFKNEETKTKAYIKRHKEKTEAEKEEISKNISAGRRKSQDKTEDTNLKKFDTKNSFQNQKRNEIADAIQSMGIDIVKNDKTIISPLELDIYVPSKKFAVEFNANHWHSEERLGHAAKNKHFHKTNLCKFKGVKLFHIFEHQWDNRKKQILNFIRSALGQNEKNVYARKCIVTHNSCTGFLNNNHIQGYGRGTIKYFNLKYDNEIVASMTASKHHRQNGTNNSIVLNRLCFKDNLSIPGGASKLFKQFKKWSKSEGYDSIISWSDNCWTDGKIYRVLSFVLDDEYGPDYFYWDSKKHKVYSKQSQQKKKTGCPEGMTEREWCLQRGLWRVWDCGKKKWTYNLN